MRRDDTARDEVSWGAVAPSWGSIACELCRAVEDWEILEQIWAWKLCWPHRRGLRGKQAIDEAQQGLGSNIFEDGLKQWRQKREEGRDE